ncbi:MAG: adenine phosphoribosyltransferase [Chlamydiae bacterium]|nr:adenine phosphoribosyltransferase [Chlamydiota bacterium]
MQYKDFITDVPNWPVEGILFRDITPLLENQKVFNSAIDDLSVLVENFDVEPNLVVGIESRGFIFGAGVAIINGNGFIPVRKEGKLPPPTQYIDATKEYGNEVLEVKAGTGDVVIVDDVVATGGTLRATEKLLTEAGYNVIGAIVLIDLTYLHSEILIGGQPVQSLIKYDE